jgi:hypothetical protein
LWGGDDDDDDEDGAGGPRYRAAKQQFHRASCNDGYIEVLSVASSFQLGAAQVGLARPTRLRQCKRLTIRTKGMALPLQVDGEPLVLPETTTINLSFLNQSVVLCKHSGPPPEHKMLPLAEADKIIQEVLDSAHFLDPTQKNLLRAEFSKRTMDMRKRSVSLDSELYS